MTSADNDKGEKLEISCITGGNTNGTLLWGKKKVSNFIQILYGTVNLLLGMRLRETKIYVHTKTYMAVHELYS